MPITKTGKKIMSNLKKEYGEKKGEGVFYAMENQGRIPGMKKMKSYAKGGDTKEPVRTQRTASGAQQMDRGLAAIDRARRAIMQRVRDLGGEKAFEEEYGRSYSSILNELYAADNARLANNLRRKFGNTRENSFDSLERSAARRASGYAKGGMVKSTGKINKGTIKGLVKKKATKK